MDVLAGWRGVLGQPTVEPGQGALQPELLSTADAGAPLHPLPVYWKIGAMIGRLHRSLAEYPHAFPPWTIDDRPAGTTLGAGGHRPSGE